MTIWTGSVIVGLMAALLHAWYRANRAEEHYRKLCLIGTAITMHNGKVDGMSFELTAPAELPDCPLEFHTRICANDNVSMRVELMPPEAPRRRQEPEIQLDEDMAAALA